MPPSRSQHLKTQTTFRPLAVVLRQHRHRRWIVLWGSLIALTAICIADHAGYFVYPGDMLNRYEGRWFTVSKVVDGDTLDIRTGEDDQTVRLRLWGLISRRHGAGGN